ncbi:shikimate kinase [Sphingobacterium sp. SG20118]|uniref:shikimate kinase n=1 Tax=Sphingobacterium TaxID=28453 RepID=UPI0004F69FA5|nr:MULTISPECIES: shikimate kinase [Sphingobacterium]AIM36000.1 shikimate kinase [Sphingobacterium sp. ML3W]MDH5827870.1 shikimate kinase [Sphingobacterium faecium]
MPKPIYLIGYMGSGKTTLAKKLTSKLALPFIDTDEEIVKEIGMSITEYFQLHGEDKFRALERRHLQNTALQEAIVSTGGGSPCFFDNMQWMNENGITVYLEMSPKSLFDRLSQSKPNKRPILIGKTEEELFHFISEKLIEREPFYKQAHLTIDHINTSIEELILLLKKHS